MGLFSFSTKSELTKPNPIAFLQEELTYIQSFPFSYVVLDIETTGFSAENDYIIEVAAIKIEGNRTTGQFSSLIKPPCKIPSRITALTGISDYDMAEAPQIERIVWDIFHFIDGYTIIGHNITFDLNFLQHNFKQSGIQCNFHYVDTCALARRCFPYFDNHRLETLIQAFSISSGQSHRALDDVMCTQKLFTLCQQELGSDIETKPFPCTAQGRGKGVRRKAPQYASIKDLEAGRVKQDLSHPLYGKKIVFTGELSISRKEAMQMSVDVGAIVRSAISRKTDFLVVGMQDCSLVGIDGMSAKEEQAYLLNGEGQASIQIISEDNFLSLVAGDNNLNPSVTAKLPANINLSGMVFVFTGLLKRHTRVGAAEIVEALGGRVSGSVSPKTNFLIAGADAGQKLEKAKELGISIITEDEFCALVGTAE